MNAAAAAAGHTGPGLGLGLIRTGLDAVHRVKVCAWFPVDFFSFFLDASSFIAGR
jgi:hypothetical protein